MEDNLRKQISSIRKLSSQFNTLSDELNKTVVSIERFLNVTCSVGIPALVLVSDSPSRRKYLEYRRVSSKFRIAIVEVETEDPWNEAVKPWADCTRDEKLETFKKLPELLAKIAEDLQ